MLISNLTQHGECKEGHLVATRFKQFWIKLANLLPFFYIPYNLTCYIWVSLKTWSVYVYANHNIITFITKNIINIQSWSNINIPLEKETKYRINDQKLATFKSWNFKAIFIHLMWISSGHLVQLVETSIYQNTICT
jgi:hypothetical protein